MALRVCPSCSRHARDLTCPFCGAGVPQVESSVLPRSARIALVSAAAVAAVAATSCSSMYGGAPIDSGPPVDSSKDAPTTFDAAYGGPPFDASKEAAPDASDGSTDSGSD